MFPTSPENELKPGMLSRTKGFSIAPYNLLSLPEFGAQTDPYEYEIWTDGSYLRHKDIGGFPAIIVSHWPLGVPVDGVDHCKSSTQA
jgi:hypothetical protein